MTIEVARQLVSDLAQHGAVVRIRKEGDTDTSFVVFAESELGPFAVQLVSQFATNRGVTAKVAQVRFE